MTRRVCVFASSSPKTPPRYLDEAARLGSLLAERGVTCVNGAGNTGCMGALNDAVLAAGGRVEGVILRQFHDQDLGHRELHDLIIAENMRDRKRMLGDRAHAYCVLPGGPGTWEEFWEVAVERQIGTHHRPLALVNTDGFYDGFIQQAHRGHAEGMLYGPIKELFTVVADADSAADLIAPGGADAGG